MNGPLPTLQVRRVNYRNASDAAALLALLDMYSRDPMGGGEPLGEATKARLCNDLARHPLATSFIAWIGDAPVGLINCFEAYSTFKARPLLNVHDIAVDPGYRGKGIGQALLAAAQAHALDRGCCKLTLEVLSGNARAMASYEKFGFANYQLEPSAGHALLMQKWL
jgi:ribosomal protein S18 acetylase RimI-like enzyme